MDLNCRFTSNMRLICPAPHKVDKLIRGPGTANNLCAMCLKYDLRFHMAIANMRRLDGTQPPLKNKNTGKITKTLEFFAPSPEPMWVSFESSLAHLFILSNSFAAGSTLSPMAIGNPAVQFFYTVFGSSPSSTTQMWKRILNVGCEPCHLQWRVLTHFSTPKFTCKYAVRSIFMITSMINLISWRNRHNVQEKVLDLYSSIRPWMAGLHRLDVLPSSVLRPGSSKRYSLAERSSAGCDWETSCEDEGLSSSGWSSRGAPKVVEGIRQGAYHDKTWSRRRLHVRFRIQRQWRLHGNRRSRGTRSRCRGSCSGRRQIACIAW